MIDAFDNLKLDLLCVSETWLSNKRSQEDDLKYLEEGYGISNIKRNRNKKRGGGVAIFYKKNALLLKQCYPFPERFEGVCAIGKGVGSNRKIFVVSVYIPPKMAVGDFEEFAQQIAGRIERAKSEHDNPLIIIASDLNRRDLSHCLADFSDTTKLDIGNTRAQAPLDCCYSNMSEGIKHISVRRPLTDENGTESDHGLVFLTYSVPRRHHFTKTVEFRRLFNESGAEKLVS